MAVGDIYELRIFWADSDGKHSENVMHWSEQSDASSADPFIVAGAVMESFLTAVQPSLLACVSPSVTLTAYSCRRINNGGGPTNTAPIGSAGTRSGDTATNSIALNLCAIPGEAPYQRKEGHFYLAGFPAADLIGDIIQSGLITAVDALIALYNSYIIALGANFQTVIVDRATKVGVLTARWLLRATITPMRRRLRPRQD